MAAAYDELLPVESHLLIDHNFSVGHRLSSNYIESYATPYLDRLVFGRKIKVLSK